MNWTLTKKLDAFAGPGEIKTREVVLDPQVSPGEIKSMEVELGFCFSCFPVAELRTLSLFCIACSTIAIETAIAWCDGRCAMPDRHCFLLLLFWRRSPAALVFRVGACFEVSLLCPPFPTRPRQ